MHSPELTLDDFRKYPIAYPVDHSEKAPANAGDVEETDDVQAPPPSPKTLIDQHPDIAAQSWKGKDSIVPYAKPVAVAGIDAQEPAARSWWQSTKDNIGTWWNGEEPVDPEVDQIKADKEADVIDYKPNIPLLPAEETVPIQRAGTIEEMNNVDEGLPPSLEPLEIPTVPTHDENGAPVDPELLSLRQMCIDVLTKKSRNIEHQFAEKRDAWVETNGKVKDLKAILRLLPKCKKADGSLDLNEKNEHTEQLVKHLEKHYNGAAFDRTHTPEKYEELFNIMKQAQDEHAFNNSALAEEMRHFSTERADLHQMMFAVIKSDSETCRSIISKFKS